MLNVVWDWIAWHKGELLGVLLVGVIIYVTWKPVCRFLKGMKKELADVFDDFENFIRRIIGK